MTDASISTISAPPMIIQGAQVLLPSGELAQREVAIADGKITAVGIGLEVSASTQTIDAEGLTLLPGIIAPHVTLCATKHINQDSLLAHSSAYAQGGITSFLWVPHLSQLETTRLVSSRLVSSEAQAAQAHPSEKTLEDSSLINYGFFISAADDLAKLSKEIPSCCGLYLSVGDSRQGSLSTGSLSAEEIAKIERLFAEGDRLIVLQRDQASEESALVAIELALKLSKQHKRRLHILNLSTATEIALVQTYKPSWISVECTLGNLLSNLSEDDDFSPSLIQSEPLWRALEQGTIDCIAADCIAADCIAADRAADRAADYADSPYNPCSPSITETSLPLLLTQAQEGRCSVVQVSRWLSTAVARVYGISHKGLIEPGYDADFVLVDLQTYRPVRREELQTGAFGNEPSQDEPSPYEGWPLTGWPVITISGGQVVYDRGETDRSVRGRALQFDAN